MTQNDQATWQQTLSTIHDRIIRKLTESRNSGEDIARAVAKEGGDTIFAIDKHVEPIIEEELRKLAPWSILLIAEGFGQSGRVWIGPRKERPDFRVLIDPIDGTRNIMYDLRSAWFIAAVFREPADREPTLRDAWLSCAGELPNSKQTLAERFFAVANGPAEGRLIDTQTGRETALPVVPSRAPTLSQGFAMVSNFFPGTKQLASELMEYLAVAHLGPEAVTGATVFEDQYMSTAGQMMALATGKYRFCCDLRPMFYRLAQDAGQKSDPGLACHPYDCAGALIAQRAGVVLRDGLGKPLDAPLDVDTGVSWVGYANRDIQRALSPLIAQWFREKGFKEEFQP